MDCQPIRSQPGPQTEFMKSHSDLCIYGGSAGGGKSFGLLLKPLLHIGKFPGFGAVIFRRNCPNLTNEGSLWDQSCELYPYAGGVAKVGDLTWTFPPFGNTITFSHLEHEQTKYNWGSSQICGLEFDELDEFSEGQFFFMLSRNRSLCGVQPYVRAATNPSPGWLKKFLEPWVDDEFEGVRAQSGELRWFIRNDDGKIQWVPEGTPDSKSLTFIRASVYDNKILLERNPEYLTTLKSLLPVDRARLLYGDWNARREGLVYPDFQSCIIDELPINLG